MKATLHWIAVPLVFVLAYLIVPPIVSLGYLFATGWLNWVPILSQIFHLGEVLSRGISLGYIPIAWSVRMAPSRRRLVAFVGMLFILFGCSAFFILSLIGYRDGSRNFWTDVAENILTLVTAAAVGYQIIRTDESEVLAVFA